MADARRSAAAGFYYPAQEEELSVLLDDLLAKARLGGTARRDGPPRALIVPHGTFAACGPVAASAWALVTRAPASTQIDRVVILGPAHHRPFRGVAAPFADAIATPLGTVAVDCIAVETVRSLPQFVVSDAPHDQEHSVDVQLPFVQRLLPGVPVVPLVVGEDSELAAAAVLDVLWREGTLVVVSADLSRYQEAQRGQRLDQATAEAIESLDGDAILEEQVCGLAAVRALLRVARRRGLRASRLELRQFGPPEEVVGFGAFVLC